MMRHHHESGIRMAEMELKNGKDPEMKRIAQQNIDSQKKEIGEFDRWLKDRKAVGNRCSLGMKEQRPRELTRPSAPILTNRHSAYRPYPMLGMD